MKYNAQIIIALVAAIIMYDSVAQSNEIEPSESFRQHALSLVLAFVPTGSVVEDSEYGLHGGDIIYSNQFIIKYDYYILKYLSLNISLANFNINIERADSYNMGTLLDLPILLSGVFPLMDGSLELFISLGTGIGLFFRQIEVSDDEPQDKIGFSGPNIPSLLNLSALAGINYFVTRDIFICLEGGWYYRYLYNFSTVMGYISVGAGAGVRF